MTKLINPIGNIINCLLTSAGALLAMMLLSSMTHAQQNSRPPAESAVLSAGYKKLLRDADALIKSGQPAPAYALLETYESEYAGLAGFDYLLGVAALDSGKPDKATLALERALIVNPDFSAARLDMARAYYQLGDLRRAKTEFTLILTQNPDARAQNTIHRYLDKIAMQESGTGTRVSGYIEGMLGRDNNVNNSTSQADVFVDVMGANRTLDPTNVKTSDHYFGIAAGGEVTQKLNAFWSAHVGADIRQRDNSSQNDFDTRSLDARVGVSYASRAHRLSAGVLAGQNNLAGAHNRDVSGYNAEWRYMLNPRNQFKMFGQYAQYRFAEQLMQVNDFNQQALGFAWLHVLSNGGANYYASVYQGSEQDVSTIISFATPNGGRADGEKKFKGLRIGGMAEVSDNTALLVNAGLQLGEYSNINPLFLRQRSDRLYDLSLGSISNLDRFWSLRPKLNYSNNNSNLSIYSYDRMNVSLTIRRDFR